MDTNPDPAVAPKAEAPARGPLSPLREFARGMGEVGMFLAEVAGAILEFLIGLGPWRRKRRRLHPIEKGAPFPIND